jgi:hypothetical protein
MCTYVANHAFYLVEDVVEEVLAEVGGDVGAGVAVKDGE